MSSRQIAEAHYKLSMVLDLTSGRLSDAIEHAEKALESVLERIQEIKDGLKGELPPALVAEPGADKKGKGKATPSLSLAGDLVGNMSKSQMESELQELEGLKEDLAVKVGLTTLLSDMHRVISPPGRRAQDNTEGADRIGTCFGCKSARSGAKRTISSCTRAASRGS